MSALFLKLKMIGRDSGLRNRLLFIVGILTLFRVGATIPIPGVDRAVLVNILDNQFFGLLNIFSGGGLSNLSIMMLGVGPFITAAIIMQLSTVVSSRMKEMYHEEGEAGRQKFNQYSRLLTVPLAILQAVGLLVLLQREGFLPDLVGWQLISSVIIVAAGSILLMWLGEQISQYGIGNGVSILIFAGIVASLPSTIYQVIITFDPAQLPIYLGFTVAAVAIVGGVVAVTEAERPIPITYSRSIRGQRSAAGIATYLPIRLNNAGVMPIIFALSILLFPQMLVNLLGEASSSVAQTVVMWLEMFVNNMWLYGAFYFALVFAFTFFYSAITFEPNKVATNLQKSGAYVPGIRPGQTTANYIAGIVARLTFIGAVFLGFIAVLPFIMQSVTGQTALALGGTGLLIVVSVTLDLVKKIDAQITMREY
ncbi:MAG: preprotein translocase subunit SecY [Patescibacteria group bacterium]